MKQNETFTRYTTSKRRKIPSITPRLPYVETRTISAHSAAATATCVDRRYLDIKAVANSLQRWWFAYHGIWNSNLLHMKQTH